MTRTEVIAIARDVGMRGMRTHWKLPTLICSGPVGGYLDFDAAIDAVRK